LPPTGVVVVVVAAGAGASVVARWLGSGFAAAGFGATAVCLNE